MAALWLPPGQRSHQQVVPSFIKCLATGHCLPPNLPSTPEPSARPSLLMLRSLSIALSAGGLQGKQWHFGHPVAGVGGALLTCTIPCYQYGRHRTISQCPHSPVVLSPTDTGLRHMTDSGQWGLSKRDAVSAWALRPAYLTCCSHQAKSPVSMERMSQPRGLAE